MLASLEPDTQSPIKDVGWNGSFGWNIFLFLPPQISPEERFLNQSHDHQSVLLFHSWRGRLTIWFTTCGVCLTTEQTVQETKRKGTHLTTQRGKARVWGYEAGNGKTAGNRSQCKQQTLWRENKPHLATRSLQSRVQKEQNKHPLTISTTWWLLGWIPEKKSMY